MAHAAPTVQPAYDLITRNFGAAAAKTFNLTLHSGACSGGGHGCFSIAEGSEGLVEITAGSMSDLTYGIGYYTRFSCGLTVGWKRGGGRSL
eukprot:COSAG03_NODE_6162_length_1104_cov_1.226866_1_plen_90_part_10